MKTCSGSSCFTKFCFTKFLASGVTGQIPFERIETVQFPLTPFFGHREVFATSEPHDLFDKFTSKHGMCRSVSCRDAATTTERHSPTIRNSALPVMLDLGLVV